MLSLCNVGKVSCSWIDKNCLKTERKMQVLYILLSAHIVVNRNKRHYSVCQFIIPHTLIISDTWKGQFPKLMLTSLTIFSNNNIFLRMQNFMVNISKQKMDGSCWVMINTPSQTSKNTFSCQYTAYLCLKKPAQHTFKNS